MADSINPNNVETLVANIKAYGSVIKYGLIALLVGGGWYATRPATPTHPIDAQHASFAMPQGLVSQLPPQAAAPATVTFTVASVGKRKDGSAAYLNSKPSFRDAGNQSIELSGAVASTPVESLKGRTVSATGVPGRNGNIVITDISQLKLQ